jgi:hypothetical protein
MSNALACACVYAVRTDLLRNRLTTELELDVQAALDKRIYLQASASITATSTVNSQSLLRTEVALTN